jgi:CSLREA domain-containing protein
MKCQVSLALVVTLFVAPFTQAAQILVTKLDDTNDGACDGDCSLREAIDTAVPGDTIGFAAGLTGTSTLQLGELVVDTTLTIVGPGRSALTLSGGDTQRIFHVLSTGNLFASGLTLAHGLGQFYAPLSCAAAGAVLNNGSFAFTDCAFTDNHSDGKTGSVNNDAGAIYSDAYHQAITLTRCSFENNSAAAGASLDIDAGVLTITDSTFSNNLSSLGVSAAVIANSLDAVTITGSTFFGNSQRTGGAIYVSGFGGTTIENSTFTGNASVFDGGALYVDGPLELINVTLSANSALSGNDLYVAPGGTLTVENTIVADTAQNCAGTGLILSAGYNLDSGATCGLNGPGDLVDTPSNLVPLQDNGGPTRTMALTPCSAATDAGSDASCRPTDQRGIARPQGSHCDIGAFEMLQGAVPSVSFCSDKRSLTWGAAPGATGYDLAYGRTFVDVNPFGGDFSGFRTPSSVSGCPVSCGVTARAYDTGCAGALQSGLLEMWMARVTAAAPGTWDDGGRQSGTRDDSAAAPNPKGIPHALVCP